MEKEINQTQQTVVDKIVALLNKEGFATVLNEEEIKLFKEIHKEQIEEAYNHGWDSGCAGEDCLEITYYKQTYGDSK